MDASAVEVVLSSLCIVISRPASLFDLYAAIAALDEVVNATKEKKDDRASRFGIVLRQRRPVITNPGLQQMLIGLVASKVEAEVARMIAKAAKGPFPINRGAFVGRTRISPCGSKRGNLSFRPPWDKRCWVLRAGHISRSCPGKG